MTLPAWAQLTGFLAVLLLTVRPGGLYLQRVFAGEATVLSPLLRPLEATVYWLAGVRRDSEQGLFEYVMAFLLFHLPGMALLYLMLRLQDRLPFNPAAQPPVPPDLALNTAISFATNTSWQSYGGEATLGYFAQMAGIAVQSFLPGAAGIAVAVALIRGFARHGLTTIGNFWVDLTRAVLYVMLPVCVVAALFLAWQGVPQTLSGPITAPTLQGPHQTIAFGPVASQESIKLLSGNGGGFFNAQSAHPFENPTVFTNLLGLLLMPLIGAALTNCFRRMVGNERQGWTLLLAMLGLLIAGAVALQVAEHNANPLLAGAGLEQQSGNLEGKKLRFGVPGSTLFSELGTATSSGAVNAMQDSYLPLSGLALLANMMLDEVIIGGPGSGLFDMLMYALVAVFIGGPMIGRTLEYVANKIESREIKLVMLAILSVPATLLALTALAVVLPVGPAGLGNTGPHGFSEVLYAYTSATNTNGSALAGLSTNSGFFNLTLVLAMVVGRFGVMVPVLALAGSLAGKRRVPASAGTLPTTGPLWVGLLLGVIVIVGGLSYLPP